MKANYTVHSKIIGTLLWLFIAIGYSGAQSIWYVSAHQTGDGTSWANATGDLQRAIDSAQVGDAIWVAKGIYKPTSKTFQGTTLRFQTFLIDKNIHIYGGFSGGETQLDQRNWAQNESVISGLLTPTDTAYHVITILGQSSYAITDLHLDGFIIENGRAIYTGPGSLPRQNEGGAVYIITNSYTTNPSFYNCIFRNNFAIRGGAVHIEGNNGQALPTFMNCAFYNNTAHFGGAFYIYSNAGNNQLKLYNCSVTHNTSVDEGGGIYYSVGSPSGLLIGAILYNTILWDNDMEEVKSSYNLGYVQAFSCIVDDGNPDGTVSGIPVFVDANCLDYDPMFVDPANGNLRVYKQSPAIDAGSDSYLSAGATWDLLHKPRIYGDSVDIGAYENYCPQSSPKIYVHKTALGNNTGESWSNAYTDLQEGMDQACFCDSTTIVPVWVGEGTYYPTLRSDESNPQTARFLIEKNVKLYGGFAGNELSFEERYLAAHPTILEGDIGISGDTSDNVQSIMEISSYSGVPITTDCVVDGFIFQNGGYQLGNRGGGISLIRGSGLNTPMIANCLFRNNRGGRGGLYSTGAPSIFNCVFYNNTGTFGGALSTFSFDTATYVTNCTFYNNRATEGGAIHHRNDNLHIHNSIFWANGDQIVNDGNTLNLSHCAFDDGNPDGSLTLPANLTNVTGNIDSDPLFVDAANSNLRLVKSSPAIDQGNNSVVLSLVADLDGQPRINGTVDMGAYEQPYVNCPNNLLLDMTYGPIDGTYLAGNTIIVQQGASIESPHSAILNAPEVSINTDFFTEPMSLLEVQSLGCSPSLEVLQQLIDEGKSIQSLISAGVSIEAFYGIRYQGGLIFYLNEDGSGMVAALQPFSGGYEWGCDGNSYTNGGSGIGSGYQNTENIVNSNCGGRAAQECWDYSWDGHSDWFLPGLDELFLVYENLIASGHGNIAMDIYYSSSEDGIYYAKTVDFSQGIKGRKEKISLLKVIPVRNF